MVVETLWDKIWIDAYNGYTDVYMASVQQWTAVGPWWFVYIISGATNGSQHFYAIRKSNLILLISSRIRESLNQQDILNAHLLHIYTLYKLHLTEPTYSFDFSYLIWPLKPLLSIYGCVGTGIISLQHKGRTLQPGEVYMPGRPMPKVVYMLIGTRISIVRSRIGSFFV